MIHILSYYNQESKNGGANRLDALASYLSGRQEVRFLTLSPAADSQGDLRYWKNSGVFIQLWVVLYKVMFFIGVTLTKDPYYKRQALAYYRTNINSSDTLVVSYPSIDDVFVGIDIFRRYKCKLNIDFRDSMLDFPLEKFSWFQKRRINNIFEKIGQSDLVVTTGVSSPICDSLRCFFKNVQCVTNFRPNIHAIPFHPKLGKHVRALFYGSLASSYDRSSTTLINAIRLLSSRNQEREFHFSFFGNYTKGEIASFASLGRLTNLTLEFSEPVSLSDLGCYEFAILWGVPGNQGYVSSKFFSYLQLSLPIIAAAEGNQVGEYIRDFSVGYSLSFNDKFLADGFSKLEKSDLIYTSDVSVFSSENVLDKWSSIIL